MVNYPAFIKEPAKYTEQIREDWNQLSQRRWCPSIQTVTRVTTLILIGLLLWGIGYSLAGDHVAPDSQLFRLVVMFILAYIAGWLISFLTLPPLLGMLLTGILLRNIGFIELSGSYVELGSTLREVSLVIILTRAGLGLDGSALKRLGWMVFRLASIPSITEGFFVTIMSHYLLDLPWLWGVLLGSILAAVSPAVVIPCLFALQERGYGRKKGIPTLIIAAASFDDVLAISVFGVVISIIFSSGDLVMQILQGPLGVVIGIAFGIVWGFLGWILPHKRDPFVIALRFIMVAGGGLISILGSEKIGFQGAGPLGVLVLSFVACLGWKKHGWTYEENPVKEIFAVIWTFFQPILFSLIGSEVKISVLDADVVGYAIAALVVALLARILISIGIAWDGGLTWKEKTFIAWAWFPKATVQAALGPVALDIARRLNAEEEIVYGEKVLITSVLAIIITAPIGAILITVLGPILLKRDDEGPTENEHLSQNQDTEENNGVDVNNKSNI